MSSINLYLLIYELFGSFGYGKGVAVISASSITEAQTILEARGEYNGTTRAYHVIETVMLSNKNNYTASCIISEVNYTSKDII